MRAKSHTAALDKSGHDDDVGDDTGGEVADSSRGGASGAAVAAAGDVHDVDVGPEAPKPVPAPEPPVPPAARAAQAPLVPLASHQRMGAPYAAPLLPPMRRPVRPRAMPLRSRAPMIGIDGDDESEPGDAPQQPPPPPPSPPPPPPVVATPASPPPGHDHRMLLQAALAHRFAAPPDAARPESRLMTAALPSERHDRYLDGSTPAVRRAWDEPPPP